MLGPNTKVDQAIPLAHALIAEGRLFEARDLLNPLAHSCPALPALWEVLSEIARLQSDEFRMEYCVRMATTAHCRLAGLPEPPEPKPLPFRLDVSASLLWSAHGCGGGVRSSPTRTLARTEGDLEPNEALGRPERFED